MRAGAHSVQSSVAVCFRDLGKFLAYAVSGSQHNDQRCSEYGIEVRLLQKRVLFQRSIQDLVIVGLSKEFRNGNFFLKALKEGLLQRGG